MAASREGMKSTILTAIRSTTILATSPLCFVENIEVATNQSLDTFASAAYAEKTSVATNGSGQDVVPNAGVRTTRVLRENAEPAFNLTVDVDQCYFVKGDDEKAYLVSNSSHAADAAGLMAIYYETRAKVTDGWGKPLRRKMEGVV